MMKTGIRTFLCVIAAWGVAASASATVASRRTPVVAAVEKALPGVVNIGTEKLVKVRYADPQRRFRGDLFDEFFRDFFGAARPGYQVRHSLGSGVIIDERGYILTNYHVIERASRIRVTLDDESEYDAVFLAGDEVGDLALLKIDAGRPLQAIEFAGDADLMLGETVIVLGNPFGLAHTVTVGVLSAKDREARYQGEVLYRDILQTDAAVNPGSSGGPLLNLDAQLIGINVAIYREAQNIGFAVPIRRVRELAGRWLSPRLARKLTPGFDAEMKDGGVAVARLDGSSPAPVRAGDRILGVGDRFVGDLFDFHQELLGFEPGSKIALQVGREGETGTVEVALSAVPKPSGEQLAKDRLGLEFSAEPPSGVAANATLGKGLVVKSVVKESPAAASGLRPGMIVTRINDAEIGSLDEVGMALENARAGDSVVLGLLSVEESGSFIVAQRSAVALVAR